MMTYIDIYTHVHVHIYRYVCIFSYVYTHTLILCVYIYICNEIHTLHLEGFPKTRGPLGNPHDEAQMACMGINLNIPGHQGAQGLGFRVPSSYPIFNLIVISYWLSFYRGTV